MQVWTISADDGDDLMDQDSLLNDDGLSAALQSRMHPAYFNIIRIPHLYITSRPAFRGDVHSLAVGGCVFFFPPDLKPTPKAKDDCEV
jgi:hypothetical protein